ncbi:MAG: DNA mismatch repair protein MutS [Lutibacter sp.]
MYFKINDNVAVIDDILKGKVIAIENDNITVAFDDGFQLQFKAKDLVLISEDQNELSKFSDISNRELIHKETDYKSKNKIVFKGEKNKKKIPPMEVDLHINQLVLSTRGLDASEMLDLQINTAKQKLEFAIRNRIPKIIFIHGVGEGVLKSELEFLFKKYPVSYYEASFQKYGLGATEVYIYQNPK